MTAQPLVQEALKASSTLCPVTGLPLGRVANRTQDAHSAVRLYGNYALSIVVVYSTPVRRKQTLMQKPATLVLQPLPVTSESLDAEFLSVSDDQHMQRNQHDSKGLLNDRA